jgi:xanthine/uracil permease
MGTLIHRHGVRPFTGIVAWPLRFAACAIGSPAWLVIASQLLHGFNIVFAMVGASIAVDLMARSDARASAQALLAVVCDGVGSLLGMLLCGAVFPAYALPGGGHNWPKIYTVPLAMTLLASMLFLALFRERDVKKLPVLEPVPGGES